MDTRVKLVTAKEVEIGMKLQAFLVNMFVAMFYLMTTLGHNQTRMCLVCSAQPPRGRSNSP